MFSTVLKRFLILASLVLLIGGTAMVASVDFEAGRGDQTQEQLNQQDQTQDQTQDQLQDGYCEECDGDGVPDQDQDHDRLHGDACDDFDGLPDRDRDRDHLHGDA